MNLVTVSEFCGSHAYVEETTSLMEYKANEMLEVSSIKIGRMGLLVIYSEYFLNAKWGGLCVRSSVDPGTWTRASQLFKTAEETMVFNIQPLSLYSL